MKEIVSEEKQLYLELFELYKHRVKTKHLTYEAFRFERVSAEKLSWAANNLVNGEWKVSGYFPFNVFVEKYIQPVFKPKLY